MYAVDSERSFEDGLEGAKRSSIASALALPSEDNASANTIVSLQLPIAGITMIWAPTSTFETHFLSFPKS